MKLRNTLIFTIGIIITFALLWFFLPSLAQPFLNFSILLLLSIYVWSAIKVRVRKQGPILRTIFVVLFWLPMVLVGISSIALLKYSLDDWPPFLKVYFIGGLFTYIVSLLLPIIFLFIADIVKWIEMLFKKKDVNRTDNIKGNEVTRRKFIVNTGLSLGGIALGTMGFGMIHGNYNFKIWRHQLKVSRASQALKGLRIVQISDFHLGTWVSKTPLEEAVKYINDLQADLIFFTGDLVNSQTAEAFPFQKELSKVKAKLGVYASLGNHDYGHYHNWADQAEEEKNWADLLGFYENMDWKLLRNESETIEIQGSVINVIGVENWSKNPRFPRIGDLDEAIRNNPTAELNLLLSHDPTHWSEKVIHSNTPIDITFSGHTHGFQFGIESSLFRWSPAQYIYKHWAGIYQNKESEIYLNVNRGIGAIGFPGRVGIKPEITLVEIA